MKIQNIFLSILAGGAMLGTASCVESIDYTPAEPVALAAYYFSTGNSPYQELEGDETSFPILLGRTDTKGDLTLDIKVTNDRTDIFTIPTTATFADGEGTTTIEVTIDATKLEKKTGYNVSLELAGIDNTPYYLGKYDLEFYYNPWETMEQDGQFYEVSISSIFQDVEPEWVACEFQTHEDYPGIYRIVDPYINYSWSNAKTYNTTEKHYMYLHTENPECCYFETFATGLTLTQYGEFSITTEAYLMISEGKSEEDVIEAGMNGTLEEGNILFPSGTVLTSMPLYQNGQFSLDNAATMQIILPGAEPISEWTNLGECNFTDGFYGPYKGILDNTYKVLVQKHKKNKGMYRIVNPFGPESGYVTEAPQEPVYMEINARNADCVLFGVTQTPGGNTLNGALMVTTIADMEFENGTTKEELIEAGYGGKLKDGVITLPGDEVQLYFARKPTNVMDSKTPVNVVLDLSPYIND